MTRKTATEVRDYAMQGFKVYQDLIYSAADKGDIGSVRLMFDAFERSFENFLERPAVDSAEILELRIQHATSDEDRGYLRDRLTIALTLRSVAEAFTKARRQITFMLAAKLLERALDATSSVYLEIAQFLMGHLPQNLADLTLVFESVNDRKADDEWGWHWWDFNADGRVHTVDSTSRPNRLFVVKALQILAGETHTAAELSLPHNDDLVWLFDESNGVGVPAMVKAILTHRDQYSGVLGANEFEQASKFLSLLDASRKAQLADREARLIESALSQEKVLAFKSNVVAAVRDHGKTRALANRLGIYSDKSGEPPDKRIPSWGYNQLDEKGAFIDNWHVSFAGWGESYGRGMAQTEDQRFFSALAEGCGKKGIIKGSIVTELEVYLRIHHFENPIIIHTLGHTLEFSQIERSKAFTAEYNPSCPATILRGLDGYSGVLRLNGATVPVFKMFSHKADSKNKIVIADMQRLISWDQYLPIDGEEESGDISEFVFIKVTDLNVDDGRRNKLLADDPAWLKDKPNKDEFLRAHTVVNVYEKLAFRILDPARGACLNVRSPISSAEA